jgi:PAS domain S-box-containing protein
LRKGGEYKWIQARGKIVARNEQGNPTRFIGTHCDITDRKQIEESLRITQFSFDTASIGIHLVASDARILDVNPEAARMLGYTKEELAAMSIFDIDPSVNSEIWGAIRQNSIGQGPHNFEATHRRKDGSEILVEVNTNLLEYEGRQYAICFVQDITKRKQADDDLRHLRNYLSDIIDSMPSVLIGVDNKGRVTQWNRQAELATGLTFEEANSQQLGTVFPHLMNQMAHIKTAIQERRVIRDLKVPHKQQDDVQYEDVTIFPLVANGVEGAVIRVDDVTERVRLEELMIQSEKMLSVGGLAAGMAHEINNPLAGILQNAAVLNNRLFMDLPANRTAAQTAGISMAAIQHYMELRKLPVMIENIHNSGMRASTIVKNMLGFARKSDLTVSSHDLCKLLDQAIELIETDYDMKMNYDFKQIRVKREYDDAGTLVPCEASKLQQVFLNLLKNGAEAMAAAAHGQAPPMFRLRVRGNGSWVQVEIEDNGPGMDEKTRRRVFEPFFTTKPVGKGTGLGLSVAYFIITENHSGEMEAQASENGGARFVIRLPKSGKKTAPEA